MAPYYVVDVYARDESKGGDVKFGRETVYAGYNYRASLCDKLHSSTIDSSAYDAMAPITNRLLTHLHTPAPHRSTRRFASPPVIDAVMMPLKTAQKIASMKLLNYHPPSKTYASKSAPNAKARATKNAGATASTDCYCMEDYYFTWAETGREGRCVKCDPNAYCGGEDLENALAPFEDL